MRTALFFTLFLTGFAVAQPPKTDAPAANPAFARGNAMIRDYFRDQVGDIEKHSLTDLTTKAEWEKKRPELRRQFFDMMGLWPLPPRSDLKATTTGKVEGEGFVVEKVHFQSLPGLYVTANLYLPKKWDGKKLPTILYVCGHGNVVLDGVSFGSKVMYQYHPAWFATHGYACLILDTLQLHEIPGLHHGTHHLGLWWWQTRGYTPAGIECWNAMRALDYLETRPEVDASRFGVTGRSGGGATSWWISAADDRIQAMIPVAGICDLRSHVCEAVDKSLKDGVVTGHCDCMYMINKYRWDFADVAALCAPRPLLLGNSDDDRIFPVPGYRRLADKVRKVYALYGAEEKFQLLETTGPHVDTPELRFGINSWLNRWLKNDTTTKVIDDLPPKLAPQQLKVLAKRPEGAINETVHEVLNKPATLELPQSAEVAREWWTNRKPELMKSLNEHVFAGWARNPPPLKPVVSADSVHDGVRMRGIDFVSETGIELRLFVITAEKVAKPKKIVLTVLGNEADWKDLGRAYGPAFADALLLDTKPAADAAMLQRNRAALESGIVIAAIAPRGVGPTQWAVPGSVPDTQFRRRFALVGQTLDGQQVWDVRRAVQALRGIEGFEKTPLTLEGEGTAAGVALYASLFEPTVNELVLRNLTATHREGPIFLNVARYLDVPQAVALAFPRPVTLRDDKAGTKKNWDWPRQLAALLGTRDLLKVE